VDGTITAYFGVPSGKTQFSPLTLLGLTENLLSNNPLN
jgi:hypothetical protein